MTRPGLPLEMDLENTARTSRMDWLSGGGAMGELIRSMDWSTTPLGPVESWPQSLRTTVSLCLSSTFPILIAWGPERVQIYNDAYRPICGAKHPQSMGQRFNECWASALPAVGAVVDRAQAGTGSYLENLPMILDRYGYLEEAFMTFSFSPIRDETGNVGGLFHPITETTDKMLSARRTQALQHLAARLGDVKSLAEVGERLSQAAGESVLDLPFLLYYQFDEAGRHARLLGGTGLAPDSVARPAGLDLGGPDAPCWPLARVLESRRMEPVEDLRSRFGAWSCEPYEEPPHQALLIPLQPVGAASPTGCLVAGVSVRRALDASYRAFYELLGNTVTTALTNVRAYEEEQKRAAALAEIDRAKTAFFSNVSHEFRTPLTLMLGPLEDSLADLLEPLSAGQRQRQQLIHRNGLRLLKLVNSLLDFSRIEAGRVQASYRPTDLSQLTVDLASAFESAMAQAGLTYTVTAPALPEPVYVDTDFWEKIVLNLISNAFKFTLKGGVEVQLTPLGGRVRLTVRDTGTGIPEAEMPRLFERFHRVEATRGRTYEGTGIGLALVQELVKLQGGSLRAESVEGQGSAFHVELPFGQAHLDPTRVDPREKTLGSQSLSSAFAEEALRWLPDAVEGPPAPAPAPTAEPAAPPSRTEGFQLPSRPKILIADDNADMRGYIKSLLQRSSEVRTVEDGEAAYALVLQWAPDLVLSDVMMPRLDGFGLLRKLREDARARSVPLILLSARAGTEARIEGLQAGADDYLVKPFNAPELLARVESAVRLARERTERERVAQDRIQLEQQLIGIVSHDLRSPISAILMSTQLMLRRMDLDEKTAKMAARIQASAERANRMIRDLLDFTQARLGGGLRIERVPAALHDIVWHAVEEVKLAHSGRELLLDMDEMPNGEWDSDRLSQVVINLVNNAVKYSPAPSPVHIQVRKRSHQALIEVHNGGEPIAPALLPLLFAPLQRGGQGVDKAGRSIGLGLYIVEQIVRAHGGTVSAQSTIQGGTTFSVHLPLQV
ncbi:ATP-binding protein [Cystobacter fuscus]|uniref:hybrid sensor histidine kinase/response regulator n=1 Tax=Cystobacter fuscus TaxID=43 RepID=UPI002B2CB677|nr:response regulator [Cystobacter fuscus]